MIDIKSVPMKEMKNMIKLEIDKISEKDSVSFDIVFVKAHDSDIFVKNIIIDIEKIMVQENNNS